MTTSFNGDWRPHTYLVIYDLAKLANARDLVIYDPANYADLVIYDPAKSADLVIYDPAKRADLVIYDQDSF